MKILIISHYYKHKNAMASIRPIKLAKYFSLREHDVTVLTSLQKDNWCKQELSPEPSNIIREIYAPEHKGMGYLTRVYDFMRKRGEKKVEKQQAETCSIKSTSENEIPTSGSSKNSFKQAVKAKLSWLFYYTSDRLENHFLARGLINEAKRQNLNGFDVVIATYPGAGIHTAGEWFKKKKRTSKFVADYRDPAYNPGARDNKIEARHDRHVQDRAVKCADTVVCVSHGMADSLIAQYAKGELPPVHVVNNGFDPDDNTKSVSPGFDPTKFNFVYTGALYQGRRTVDMLAKVVKELIEENVITLEHLAFNYAGPDFPQLLDQLKPYNLESTAVDYGYVSREQSLGMQQESDIVLLLNWNDDNYTGVIPGKLYEYMSVKRPICALIMGNQAGSESAKMIEEYGLGCACEHAAHDDCQKLKAYIRNKFDEFNHGIRNGMDSGKIDLFEYRNIADKYLSILPH